MSERFTTYRTHDIPAPIPEYVDTEDQLVIGHERDFIELQEPHVVREIGAYAIRRAQELIELAQHCEDALAEWGEVPKSRRRQIDLKAQRAVFGEAGER